MDRAGVRDAALPRRAARGRRPGSTPTSASSSKPRSRREHELRERLQGPSALRDALKQPQRRGTACQLRAARRRLRAHVLRAPPRAGPDRLHGLRGGRARAAIPFVFATAAMIVAVRGARARWPPLMLTGAVGTVITAYAQSPLLLTVGITLAAVGPLPALPRFSPGIVLMMILERHRRGRGDRADRRPRQPSAASALGSAFTGIARNQTGGYRAAARHARGDPRRLRPPHRACVRATTRSASATSPAMITTTRSVDQRRRQPLRRCRAPWPPFSSPPSTCPAHGRGKRVGEELVQADLPALGGLRQLEQDPVLNSVDDRTRSRSSWRRPPSARRSA